MADKKYYVIINGDNRRMIFGTWDEVKNLAQGHKGVKSISFDDKDEAQFFVEHGELKMNHEIEQRIKMLNEHDAIIFTDGSYSPDQANRVGAGAVIICLEKDENGKLKRADKVMKATSDNAYVVAANNVGGEIIAVTKSVSWAADHGITHIDLYHDYEEIAKWVTGEDRAKKELTQTYRKLMREIGAKGVKIEFHHVPGHHGINFNEKADRLAKESLND